jgi:hypothetical protein
MRARDGARSWLTQSGIGVGAVKYRVEWVSSEVRECVARVCRCRQRLWCARSVGSWINVSAGTRRQIGANRQVNVSS